MFHWRKEIDRLDVPAATIVQLHRSLADIQVALPGLPAQQATAYLLLSAAENGYRVFFVLHLHASWRLAVYCHPRDRLSKHEVGKALQEGQRFAESIGFIMGDLDFQLLDPKSKAALWDSLPLRKGVAPPDTSGVLGPEVSAEEIEEAFDVFTQIGKTVEVEKPGELPASEEIREATELEEIEEFASAEGLEAGDGLGGLEKDLGRRRETILGKKPPSAAELARRRRKLQENIGRFLASL